MTHKDLIKSAKRDLIFSMNGFDLHYLIGKGKYADVYKVSDVQTKEFMALKYFRQEPENSKRFHVASKEIGFFLTLQHPNIVPLMTFSVNPRNVFIATEYAPFGTLERILEKSEYQPESFIQPVMKQVIAALDYMHSLGVMHGDVKPRNVLCSDLIAGRPVVKLCDFGLSEVIPRGDRFIFFAGSPLYAAPEIILNHTGDLVSDNWSAGVVMYNCMFKRTLFNTDSKDVRAHINCLRRKTKIQYQGTENYSENCLDLLQQLLKYDKRARIQGEDLIKHPFINSEPYVNNGKGFLEEALDLFAHAESMSKIKVFDGALVSARQAVIKLKMHYNYLQEQYQREKLRQLLGQYEMFITSMEAHVVLIPEITYANIEQGWSDDDLKLHLASAPALLLGFEIGCKAETFLMSNMHSRALELFQEALVTILPAMTKEPKSYRKEKLGRRVAKWIQEMDGLTKILSTESAQGRAVASTSTARN